MCQCKTGVKHMILSRSSAVKKEANYGYYECELLQACHQHIAET